MLFYNNHYNTFCSTSHDNSVYEGIALASEAVNRKIDFIMVMIIYGDDVIMVMISLLNPAF